MLAQLVERLPCKQGVVSSSLTHSTKQMRGSAEVAQRAHNPKVVGSNPTHRNQTRPDSLNKALVKFR